MIIGGVCELWMPPYAVTDSVDTPVGRLEFPIDENAVTIVPNSRGLEAKPVEHRSSPGRDQQMTAGDRLFRTGRFDARRHCAAAVGNTDDIRAAANDDALSLKAIEKDSDAFRIVV